MTIAAATPSWSAPITIAEASLLQAQLGKVAVFVGSGTPPANEPGTVMSEGATVLFGPGTVRIRSVGVRTAQLHYQAWT
jgi:hypothetical protein